MEAQLKDVGEIATQMEVSQPTTPSTTTPPPSVPKDASYQAYALAVQKILKRKRE
jgi:hypothetical protein